MRSSHTNRLCSLFPGTSLVWKTFATPIIIYFLCNKRNTKKEKWLTGALNLFQGPLGLWLHQRGVSGRARMEWAELLVHTRARWPCLRWERRLTLNVLCILPASIKYLLFVAQEPAAPLIWLLRVCLSFPVVPSVCVLCAPLCLTGCRGCLRCAADDKFRFAVSFLFISVFRPDLVFRRPSTPPLCSSSGEFKRRFTFHAGLLFVKRHKTDDLMDGMQWAAADTARPLRKSKPFISCSFFIYVSQGLSFQIWVQSFHCSSILIFIKINNPSNAASAQ